MERSSCNSENACYLQQALVIVLKVRETGRVTSGFVYLVLVPLNFPVVISFSQGLYDETWVMLSDDI